MSDRAAGPGDRSHTFQRLHTQLPEIRLSAQLTQPNVSMNTNRKQWMVGFYSVICVTTTLSLSLQASHLHGREDKLLQWFPALRGRQQAWQSCNVSQRLRRTPAASARRREEEDQPAQPQEVWWRPVAHGEIRSLKIPAQKSVWIRLIQMFDSTFISYFSH